MVTTESSRQAGKTYRKLRERGIIKEGFEENVTFDDESARRLLKSALGADASPLALPNIHVPLKASAPVMGAKLALPPDTVHNDRADHEEFIIPYPRDIAKIASSIRSLKLSDMDTFLQKAFPGYTSLNQMQSAVFPVAYCSNENMLVCAPTGAGKTDVAMLAVLKTVHDHLITDSPKLVIAKAEFKIVYIAPMKALAAEITQKFSKRLQPYGLIVREYTGDIQLSRQQINETQMIVTTPEKWDVITRKSQGDVDLVQKVKLLIIDEVHLLQDDRGPVIETIVARTLREVEISQRLIRIVGLSATLPNYIDVASFLRVDLYVGLFVFGDAFRPVPLTQQFVGIKGRSAGTILENMTNVCFQKCRSFLVKGHQVMVFVHSRVETVKTAKTLLRQANETMCTGLFAPDTNAPSFTLAKRLVDRSKNRELQTLFSHGLAFHHAGMLRSDRSLVEQLFSTGQVRVLVCTSTLAWGVNLPAHAVIIKGTRVYDQQKADFIQLGILDVLQIFGRAGRPQYETHGEGIILTSHDNMAKYINAIMSQVPIESQFLTYLADNLNAEVTLGTVSSIEEAVAWLKYSYLYVRMRKNPTAYGISIKEITKDPELRARLYKICIEAALRLRDCGMISFDQDEPSGTLRIRDVGRIASLFYLSSATVEVFGQTLKPLMNEEEIIAVASRASEFNNFRVREDELQELDRLQDCAPLRVKHEVATPAGKASLLIMAHISRYPLDTFSLVSDSNYIAQNGGRVLRALFEIFRCQGWLAACCRCLTVCKAFERRMWPLQHPLTQFDRVPLEILHTLESKKHLFSIDTLLTLGKDELSSLVRSPRAGDQVRRWIQLFPNLKVRSRISPVTTEILCMELTITPIYDFDPQYHGTFDMWWIFVENPLSTNFVHVEELAVTRHQAQLPRTISFFIPLKEPIPPQLYVRIVSDRWLHAEASLPVSLNQLVLPKEIAVRHTDLLPLPPLSISTLNDSKLEALYAPQFSFFNAVQTQVFSPLYHKDYNVMLGAPTGSGKTVVCELAIWNALRLRPTSKVIYIAPLKALIKERLDDWTRRLQVLGLSVAELSGDVNFDANAVSRASIIVTTPEKFDSITRSGKGLVQEISLIVMDEIHLLGGDRGHVLEIIVARLRKLSKKRIRFIGLSTALANAGDLATWLDVPFEGLFNFRPSVRPVPLEVRIEGFAGRHYCPRMAAMNKPVYSAIMSDSPDKPVLIFVSSRRQTRLTANALVSYCANDNNPYKFVQCLEEELIWAAEQVQDPALRHSLAFGIVLHHAGLPEADRRIAETLFAAGKVQVMVATSTVAWGLNFPAHLVIVKGTEYFDARSQSYVDYPLTDVMQMIGRAGRPQFDTHAKAVLLSQDTKKDFYKKFLYDSFPLESSLNMLGRPADHLNAEIANDRVTDVDSAIEFLKDTYLAIRLGRNPNYYGLENGTDLLRDEFLANTVLDAFESLEQAHCIKRQHDQVSITSLGKIASTFYLGHRTAKLLVESIEPDSSFYRLLRLLSLSAEFDEAPLRHNEDVELKEFSQSPLMRRHWEQFAGRVSYDWTDPHTKVYILLIAYLAQVPLPFTDFVTDSRSILDQASRISSAIIEVALESNSLEVSVQAIWLTQALYQGLLPSANSILQLPHVDAIQALDQLPLWLHRKPAELQRRLESLGLSEDKIGKVMSIIQDVLPHIKFSCTLQRSTAENNELNVSLAFSFNVAVENRGTLKASAYCRDSRRPQPEFWRIILADDEQNLILASYRIALDRPKYSSRMQALRVSSSLSRVKVVLLSENYLGLDQELIHNFNDQQSSKE